MIEPILESITPYCLCRGVSKGFMLGCESCDEWFHGACINLNEKDAEKLGRTRVPTVLQTKIWTLRYRMLQDFLHLVM